MLRSKSKYFCSILLTAVSLTVLVPNQANMSPAKSQVTLKGLSQHQSRQETAVLALSTIEATDNTLEQQSSLSTTSNASSKKTSVSDKIANILKEQNKKTQQKPINYGSEAILGTAIVSQEQCVKYLLENNPNPKISVSADELVRYYYEEASKEGIRPDAAFAQALKETGYFNYGGTVTPDQNNYCGLGTTSATVKGAYFKNARLGVRAHIQHLLAYTSVRPPREKIVDPRYSLVRAAYSSSTIDTWPGLNGRWAVPGNNYGQEILDILNNIAKE